MQHYEPPETGTARARPLHRIQIA